jgi:threonine/homoserine/homoserine lactone efflux protein
MKLYHLVKIIIALLFFLCLAKLPYNYYIFVRYLAFFSFLYLAYKSYKIGRYFEIILFLFLAFLFKPFWKIYLTKNIWNTLNYIFGVYLILTVFWDLGLFKKEQ